MPKGSNVFAVLTGIILTSHVFVYSGQPYSNNFVSPDRTS